jgi:hypothetical protein
MIKIEVYSDGSAFIEGKEHGSNKPIAQTHFSVESAIQAAMYFAYKLDGKTLYKVQGVCIWYEAGCPDTAPYVFAEVIGDETENETDD